MALVRFFIACWLLYPQKVPSLIKQKPKKTTNLRQFMASCGGDSYVTQSSLLQNHSNTQATFYYLSIFKHNANSRNCTTSPNIALNQSAMRERIHVSSTKHQQWLVRLKLCVFYSPIFHCASVKKLQSSNESTKREKSIHLSIAKLQNGFTLTRTSLYLHVFTSCENYKGKRGSCASP